MKINKPKLTKLILNLACKAPMFFPKKIRSLLGQIEIIDSLSESLKDKASRIKKLSVFNEDFNWEYVSVSFLVDDHELKKINKWICDNKKNSSAQVYSDLSSFDQDISVSDIGCIPFNNKLGLRDFNPIYISSEYFDFVQIYLTKYSSGFSFVIFKFNLNDIVNEMIKNISPPEIGSCYEFNHFGFLSKKPLSLNLITYSKLFDEVIVNKIKIVNDASVELTKLILNDFGIKDENKIYFNTLGFEISEATPYLNKVDEALADSYIFYSSKDIGLHNEQNDKEVFIIEDNVKVDGVNMIFLNKMNSGEGVVEFNIYGVNEYFTIIPVFLIKNKLNSLSNRVLRSNVYSKKKKIDKFHDDIFDVFQDIKMLKVWVEKLNNNYLFFIPEVYHEFMHQELDYLSERLKYLEVIVNDSYLISENRIQIESIRFSKFNSKAILLLVLIQIFFAAMTIDFTKKDTWYFFMAEYFKSFWVNI